MHVDTLRRAYTQVLARYLVTTKAAALANATVIELGSGTGLVGLLAAHLGARVWLTDQAFVLCQRTETRSLMLKFCSIYYLFPASSALSSILCAKTSR